MGWGLHDCRSPFACVADASPYVRSELLRHTHQALHRFQNSPLDSDDGFYSGDNRHRFGTTRSRIRSSYQTSNSGGIVHCISTERLETCTAHYVPFSQHCRDVRVVFLCSGRRKGGPQQRMWQWRTTRLAS